MAIHTLLQSIFLTRKTNRTKLMCKTIALILLLLGLNTDCIYSQCISLSGKKFYSQFETIEFTDDMLVYSGIKPEQGEKFKITYNYQLIYEDGIPFLFLDGREEMKWLVLYNDKVTFVYDCPRKYPFFVGVSDSPGSIESLTFFNVIRVSSFLKEGNNEYSGANLSKTSLWAPWVENSKAYGIGEEIEISPLYSMRIWLSNGFVSYEKPYLYKANGRVKCIEVEDQTNHITYQVELRDTPCPQVIELKKQTDNVILRIIDVYEGETWEDTAINFLFRY